MHIQKNNCLLLVPLISTSYSIVGITYISHVVIGKSPAAYPLAPVTVAEMKAFLGV